MENECENIVRNTSVSVEIDARAAPKKVYLHFSNRSQQRLWFPEEREPSYRPEQGRVTIWFGYLDEIYGQYAARYFMPPMRAVPPGQDLSFELTSGELVQQLAEPTRSVRLRARVATKELRESTIRGDQPLEDYIRSSCVVESVINPVFLKQ